MLFSGRSCHIFVLYFFAADHGQTACEIVLAWLPHAKTVRHMTYVGS